MKVLSFWMLTSFSVKCMRQSSNLYAVFNLFGLDKLHMVASLEQNWLRCEQEVEKYLRHNKRIKTQLIPRSSLFTAMSDLSQCYQTRTCVRRRITSNQMESRLKPTPGDTAHMGPQGPGCESRFYQLL